MSGETDCSYAIPANSAAPGSGNHRIELNRSEVQLTGQVCRRPDIILNEKPGCRFKSYHELLGAYNE